MRELGEGMKRIFDLMHESELERPVLYSNGLWFSVTLNNKTIYSAKQQEWLNLFRNQELTISQKKIVLLGMAEKEISPLDIQNALNTKDLLTYTSEVSKLRTKGVLKEIRTNVEAKKLTLKLNKQKNQISRFTVVTK
jgi:ATP-dependent DNA helicase RecG